MSVETEPANVSLEVLLLPGRRGFRLLSPLFHTRALAEEEESPEVEGEQAASGRLSRAVRAGARGFRRLTGRRRARESLLRDLREPHSILVRHPAALATSEAEHVCRRILDRQMKKHRRWMIVDGALLPLSAILMLIPGPNVVAGYLAWRAFNHNRARGGSKAGRDTDAVHFQADTDLDRLAELQSRRFVPGRRRKLRAIGESLGVPDLDRLY